MTPERASSLPTDAVPAERVDAFVARFAGLQDTLADKLLPALLRWLGERPGPFIDNLNAAERRRLGVALDYRFGQTNLAPLRRPSPRFMVTACSVRTFDVH